MRAHVEQPTRRSGPLVAERERVSMAVAGRTFHFASLLLPTATRGAVEALYRFCRRVDNLADDGTLACGEAHAALAAIACDLPQLGPAALAAGWTEDLAQLSPVMTRAAVALVKAAQQDLTQQQPANEDQLLVYAFGVAGTVGLMMSDVLGAPSAARVSATHLGIGMQLTNIARDVAEDASTGRMYLPLSWVDRGVIRAALAGDQPAQALVAQLRLRLLTVADAYYASAWGGVPMLPCKVQTAIVTAAMAYRAIGGVILRQSESSLHKRAVVGMTAKLRCWAEARARLRRPHLWTRDIEMERRLSRPIRDELVSLGVAL